MYCDCLVYSSKNKWRLKCETRNRIVTVTAPYLFILSNKRSNINLFLWQIDMSMKTFCLFLSSRFQLFSRVIYFSTLKCHAVGFRNIDKCYKCYNVLLVGLVDCSWICKTFFLDDDDILKIIFCGKCDIIMIHGNTNRIIHVLEIVVITLSCNEKKLGRFFWSL